jgi:hypothetical protein
MGVIRSIQHSKTAEKGVAERVDDFLDNLT